MKFGNIRGIARTTTIIIAVAIIIIAAVAVVGVYFVTRPVGPKVLGKILHIHGYRGSTSEVLRASGFLDGVMGTPLPEAKFKVDLAEAARVRAARKYPDHTKVNLAAGDIPFIGYIPLGIYNPWDELNKAAFEWYCGDVLGWDYKVYWPDADVKKQNDMAEAAIAEGVDALVVCPLDSVANAKIGEMAEEAGIPVVLFGIDMYQSWPLVFCQRDDYVSGWYCGKYTRDELIKKFPGENVQVGINVPIVDVGNSWDAEAEFPYIRASMAANPDIVAVFEVMGGYHEAWVRAAKDLGWSETKIKDVIADGVDFFPCNLDGYVAGDQDYCHLMPTGCYMNSPNLEILKQFWLHGPDALPKIGDTFTVAKYIPELGTTATVPGTTFAPLQWFEDPKWGIAGTHTTNYPSPIGGVCPILPATCGAYYRPWVLIPDRIITEADYKEPCIYWNWPVFGYPYLKK